MSQILLKLITSGRPNYLTTDMIRRLHQIHVAIFLEEFSEFNLTTIQYGVLFVLSDGRALEQVTIANELGVDRNNAADVIRRLERRGLLQRPSSTKDKRAKLARITEEGQKLVNAVHPAMVRAQQRFMAPLNDEEYSQLMKLMEKLVIKNNEASRAPWRLEIGSRERKPIASD